MTATLALNGLIKDALAKVEDGLSLMLLKFTKNKILGMGMVGVGDLVTMDIEKAFLGP